MHATITQCSKTALVALTTALLMTGCSTLTQVFDKEEAVITTAQKNETAYYQDAQNALAKERYQEAILALNNIRTFYPTGIYAQQALLDLIYAQYQANNFEAVTVSTAEFIRSYPTSKHIDYALYVQGVTNMDGSPKSSRLFRLEQSERDISYLRLAFNDFSTLITRYPNSPYASDAAQRMIALYNDFAKHELVVARWYIKRDAHVAAVNRAKWVFQYYPQSNQVPEAIAILAHSHEKLGLTDTANQYKTLLQINYPHYLNADGSVRLENTGGLLSRLTFGKFGQAKDAPKHTEPYTGATRTQLIGSATSLKLPADNAK